MRLRILILIVLAAGLAAWWWAQRGPAGAAAWHGYAEADYVKVAPTQQGALTGVAVSRGDAVKAGETLFDQDDTAERAQRDQAARQLAQAEDQLANLQAGGKATEIRQAEANLADAHATLVRAQADFARGTSLLRSGAVSAQSVDQLRAEYGSAQARQAAMQAALAQLQAPLGRDREIAAQRQAAAAARAALGVAEWRLAQRHVTAPADARVADVLAQPGESVAAGTPVVSLLPAANIFVRFFVPEPALAALHRGDPVALRCDGCPADLTGAVSFISPQAEYTPPVIFSEASREKLVWLIEARPPPQQAALLSPGEPVDVRPGSARR